MKKTNELKIFIACIYTVLLLIIVLFVLSFIDNSKTKSIVEEEVVIEELATDYNDSIEEMNKLLHVEELKMIQERSGCSYIDACNVRSAIEEAVENYDWLEYEFLFALVCQESDFRYWIDSSKDAKYGRGLCQVSEIGLKEYNSKNVETYEVDDLYNPYINCKIATWLLNKYHNIHNEFGEVIGNRSVEKTLRIYNEGYTPVYGTNDSYYTEICCLYNQIKNL